jgi:hypothetical protein
VAAEVVFTKFLWDSKEFVPRSWYPSTEARIISTPNIAALFYGMTGNASLALGMACCFMTIGIIASVLYFAHKAGMDSNFRLLMVFMCLALPASRRIADLLYIIACYYAIHVIAFFLTLGFYCDCLQKRQINKGVFAFLVAFAFLLGMQGMRAALIAFVPLFAFDVLRNFLDFARKRTLAKHNVSLFLAIALLLAVNYIGSLSSSSVGHSFSRNIRKGLAKLFTEVVPDVFAALGFNWSRLASLQNLLSGILCLLSAFVLVSLLRKIWKQGELEVSEWAFLALLASPVITMLIMAFTTYDSTPRFYFGFVLAMAMSAVLFMQKTRRMAICGLGAVIILLSVINIRNVYLPILTYKEQGKTDLQMAAEYLVANDFAIAYSTNNWANPLSVAANNEIIVATLLDDYTLMKMLAWETSSEWYVPNRPYYEKTAYVVSEARQESFLTYLRENNLEDIVVAEIKFGVLTIYSSPINLTCL